MRTGRRLFACLMVLALAGMVGRAAAPTPARGPRALILYDGTDANRREGIVDALHIANLMGHFGYQRVTRPIEEYHLGEMVGFDAVFIVGGSNLTVWPAEVLRDARRRTGTLMWVGYGIDAFLAGDQDTRRGLQVDTPKMESPYTQVRYRGTLVGKGSQMITPMSVVDPKLVKVEATAVDPKGEETPYIVHTGNMWAVADIPFAYVSDHDRYLVFCDILHDVLGVKHEHSKKAMIRIEDVTPQDDPNLLRRAVQVFVDEGVPFQIGIAPIYRDPPSGSEVYLTDRPEIVKVLHEAVAKGGTIVLHGSSHQYRRTTPDDFEFWDDLRDRPRSDDSTELVRSKLAAALDECFRNDIYPIAWETPHYAASQLDYNEFARIFSTIYERPLISDQQGTQQLFPYPTLDTRGTLVVPENIGYLPVDDPSPTPLLDNARALTVVRDGIASAYVHNFIDAKNIRETVRGLKDLGYTFISLREFPCRVSMDNRLIATKGATGTVTLDDDHLRQFILAADGSHKSETWADTRQSGVVKPTLTPGPGEILVMAGMAEPAPPVPGPLDRLRSGFASLVSSMRSHSPLRQAAPDQMSAAVLWNPAATGAAADNQASMVNVFRAYGVRLRKLNVKTLTDGTLTKNEVLAVPNTAATALTPAQVAMIAKFVKDGGNLLLDARSDLAEAVGIKYLGRTLSAMSIRDNVEQSMAVRWRPPALIDDFRLPTGAVRLAHDAATGAVVMAAFPQGAGKVLYLSAPLDPFTDDATSRYPFLFEHVLDSFGKSLVARRPGLELYFDPGLRQSVSIEQLAVEWRRLGVRAIYAAAWEFRSGYSYDYARLVRVCHANGILVYAWFEFPQVTPKFWDQHPEWRLIPASGNKLPSWRLMMNLENPECRAAALAFMKELLDKYDWDGVNLAELNYDSEANGDAPHKVVPFNTEVRDGFKAKHGFDPALLFDHNSDHYWRIDQPGWQAFLDYRTSLVTEMHRAFLTELAPFQAKGKEVLLTMLDSIEHPAVTAQTGIDSRAIVALAKDHKFTLQVEDPAAAWVGPPTRYVSLAEKYKAIMPAGARFMFDVNVVPDRKVDNTHLPTSLAIGVELAATVRAARSASERVALYGDATVRPRDLELLTYAAADEATVTRRDFTWVVDSPEAVELAVPAELHDFSVDGKDWPLWRPGFVMLPPGRHTLSAYRPLLRLLDLSPLRPQVLQTTATAILSGEVKRGELTFEYEDGGPSIARLNREPEVATVDGEPARLIKTHPGGETTVVLPPGRHKVVIGGAGHGAFLLDIVSVVSSSLIVAFGTAATGLMLVLYIYIRLRRLVKA